MAAAESPLQATTRGPGLVRGDAAIREVPLIQLDAAEAAAAARENRHRNSETAQDRYSPETRCAPRL